MSEMIERVAKAMYPDLFSADPVIAHQAASPMNLRAARRDATKMARAAIEALHEPTEMMDAAGLACQLREERFTDCPAASNIWRAMIDEALK